MKKLMVLLFAVLLFLGITRVAQAGLIYSNQALFNAAVAGMTLSWSEDFEGFSQGPVPVPTIIGGGAAEISKAGTARIIPAGATPPPSGANEWLGVEGGIGETIQGLI